MLILLSDGAGLTSRQSATLLSRAGHRVEVLAPDSFCLCRFTRHVRKVHRVPAYGADPFGWLEAATAIAERRGADLLLPTQEQVAVLAAAAPHRFRTVVPGFAALAQVQDKLSAHATLARIGLPQPGKWREILNSDAGIYSGSNTGNYGQVWAHEHKCHNQNFSAEVNLPPMSIIAFTP